MQWLRLLYLLACLPLLQLMLTAGTRLLVRCKGAAGMQGPLDAISMVSPSGSSQSSATGLDLMLSSLVACDHADDSKPV